MHLILVGFGGAALTLRLIAIASSRRYNTLCKRQVWLQTQLAHGYGIRYTRNQNMQFPDFPKLLNISNPIANAQEVYLSFLKQEFINGCQLASLDKEVRWEPSDELPIKKALTAIEANINKFYHTEKILIKASKVLTCISSLLLITKFLTT
ncbi:MAG: hypothetical protein Harvfovirus15_30 [Harvfovirus sp.]|uniref:Uncharacterized protein n=1 Tax=Harvfovirus sp. TaxID=2487768 RepID=A0A3G5A1I0_9VIRU|nr:MAG: hypothetical protein Harvfovirus15_30 [Harvfovirus sp.]